jgi:hypothetical protein
LELVTIYGDKMTGKIENKFVVVTLVMALVAMVFVGGYLWDKNGGVPRSGIEGSYLEISRVPPLNETAYLTAVITPKHNYTDHGNISARIVLPEGFIFIDHDDTSTLYYDRILEWGGNLTKGTNVIFGGTIKSVKIGNWTIHAKLIWGDVPINETDNPENSYEVIGILYIHVDVDSAYIHDGPFPKPGGPDVQEGYPFVPRSPMNVNLSLSNAPPLNQTAKLTCAVSSIEDAPNTTAEIVLPEGFELINGDIIWNGNIPRDGEIEFNVTIKSIKNGNWTIEASAKCMISHDSWFENGDRIYIFVSEDKASISDEPPILPECSGMGIKLNESEIPPFESIKSNSSDTNVSLPSPVELNNASRIGSGGTLTIKGRFWYKDANDNSQPLKWATVWIYDAEWWGWDYLGATLTDTDGRFTFGPISNDDGWGQDGLDIICEAVAHTSASRVESPFWGIVYKWHTQEYTNCPDGTLDVGNWIGPSSQEGAWRIFEYITDGWDYLMNGPAGYEMAKATAKWPDGDWPYYTLGGEIHIPGDDKADRSPDIVQHEYAHHVMYTIDILRNYQNFITILPSSVFPNFFQSTDVARMNSS